MSTDPANGNRHSRLFFALWPPEQLQVQLLQRQKRVVTSGKAVDKDSLHLTLAFLGDTPKDTEACLVQRASELQHPRFEFTLDQLGYFERPKILWLGPQNPPDHLLLLHKKLASVIQSCGLRLTETTFKPHVTLSRKGRRPDAITNTPSLNWQVDGFFLVKSELTERGPEYRRVKTFRL